MLKTRRQSPCHAHQALLKKPSEEEEEECDLSDSVDVSCIPQCSLQVSSRGCSGHAGVVVEAKPEKEASLRVFVVEDPKLQTLYSLHLWLIYSGI